MWVRITYRAAALLTGVALLLPAWFGWVASRELDSYMRREMFFAAVMVLIWTSPAWLGVPAVGFWKRQRLTTTDVRIGFGLLALAVILLIFSLQAMT